MKTVISTTSVPAFYALVVNSNIYIYYTYTYSKVSNFLFFFVSVAVRLEFCSTIGVRGAGEFKGFGGGDDGGWVFVDRCDA